MDDKEKLDVSILRESATCLEKKDIIGYKVLRELYEYVDKQKFITAFKKYYGLNNAGLTDKHTDVYFDYLFKLREDFNYRKEFREIATKLHQIPRRKGDSSLQCSFVTKLLSFVDDSYPIYDKYVSNFFGICVPDKGGLDFRINVFLNNMAFLHEYYIRLAEQVSLQSDINDVKKRFELGGCSVIRIIDFLVWNAGKKKMY